MALHRVLLGRPGQVRHRATVPVAVAALVLLATCWLFWNFEVKLVIKPRAAAIQHGIAAQQKQPQPAATTPATAIAPAPVQAAQKQSVKGVKVDQLLGSYAETLEPIAQATRAVLAAKAHADAVRSAYTKALRQYSLVGAFAQAPNPYTSAAGAAATAAGAAAVSAAAWTLMTEGLRLIAANGRVVPCAMDATLPLNITSSGRYLLAANLFQCDHMMANYVLQLMRVAVLFPQGALAVSIYESGSTDHTADWVDLLRLLLLPLGVTATITPRGSLTKQHNQERIHFLATVRNAALEPYFPSQQQQNQQHCHQSGTTLTPGCFRPDWIVFLNDVQLCSSDVLRLMQYEDADMACGLDFYEPARRKHRRRALKQEQAGSRAEQQQQVEEQQAQLEEQQQQQQQEEEGQLEQREEHEHGGSWTEEQQQLRQLELWQHDEQQSAYSASFMDLSSSDMPLALQHRSNERMQQRTQQRIQQRMQQGSQQQVQQSIQQRSQRRRALRAAQAAKPEERFLFLFWDIWVGRDVTGAKFGGGSPYIVHANSAKRAMAGLPFQAYCCWNGMVKLNPDPFRRGLRFRTAQPGECRASECSLMCDDFHRLGFSRAVVDPNVRLAYTLELKSKAYKKFPHLANTTWAQAASAPHWHQQKSLNYSSIECCDLQPGAHYVDYAKDCRAYDIAATNFTAQVLPVQQQAGGARGSLTAGWAGERRSWTSVAVLLAGALIMGGFGAWLHYI